MKLASLFDGIGGALLCAERCGIEAVWSSEIEPFPQKVTQYHFPNVKHLGDITKINGSDVEPVDIIIGGSPCQDLSVAGLRKGMKHSDFGDEETTRSGLFMEQIRIVKEMRNACELRNQRLYNSEMGKGSGTNNESGETGVRGNSRTDEPVRPRFMVWENVPGAFSSNKGEDFRIVLEETARIKDKTISIPRPNGGKWSNAGVILGDGFSIAWRTIDAQYFGVPQRRRRIYLVADFGGQSAPEILFEREGVRGNTAESGAEGQRIAGNVEDGADSTVLYQPKSALEENWAESPVKNALRAEESKSSHAIVQPVICLQGNGIDRADTAGCNGKGWTEDICYTLNTIDRPAVYSETGRGKFSAGCGTLRSAGGSCGGGSENLIATTIDCRNMVENIEISGTLQAKENGGQSLNYQNPVRIEQEIAATLDCSYADKMGLDNQHVNAGCPNFVKTANTVRRLTPLECERLQGYPQVKKYVIINLEDYSVEVVTCLDHQKNNAQTVEEKCRKLLKCVGSAERIGLSEFVKCAAISSNIKNQQTEKPVPANVLINLGELQVQPNSLEGLSLSVQTVERKTKDRLAAQTDCFVQMIAGIRTTLEQTMLLGREELRQKETPLIVVEHGRIVLSECGREKMLLARDAESDTLTEKRHTKFTTLSRLDLRPTEQDILTLFCYAMNATNGFTPTKTYQKIIFESEDGYTNIPGASDSARYKALGNSFAIPCAEFVIRGIAETLALTEHPQHAQEVET